MSVSSSQKLVSLIKSVLITNIYVTRRKFFEGGMINTTDLRPLNQNDEIGQHIQDAGVQLIFSGFEIREGINVPMLLKFIPPKEGGEVKIRVMSMREPLNIPYKGRMTRNKWIILILLLVAIAVVAVLVVVNPFEGKSQTNTATSNAPPSSTANTPGVAEAPATNVKSEWSS